MLVKVAQLILRRLAITSASRIFVGDNGSNAETLKPVAILFFIQEGISVGLWMHAGLGLCTPVLGPASIVSVCEYSCLRV